MSARARSTVTDILNLGCGRKLMNDAVNVDICAEVGATVVHDLARVPWPLPSGAFRQVYAYDVIEHLDDIPSTMEEIHRVCRAGARVEPARFPRLVAFGDRIDLQAVGKGSRRFVGRKQGAEQC